VRTRKRERKWTRDRARDSHVSHLTLSSVSFSSFFPSLSLFLRRPLFTNRKSIQGTVTLLENLHVILQKTPQEYEREVLSMLYTSFENSTIQVRVSRIRGQCPWEEQNSISRDESVNPARERFLKFVARAPPCLFIYEITFDECKNWTRANRSPACTRIPPTLRDRRDPVHRVIFPLI